MSIASADELSDSALAAACSLHTAAPSSCSSNSSRRKLDEITEDAEEAPGNERDAPSLSRPTTSSSSKATITQAPPAGVPPPLHVLEQVKRNKVQAQLGEPLQRSKTAEEPRSSLSNDVSRPVQEPPSESKVSEIRNSMKAYDGLFENGPDPRLSSQTARPAMSDLYAEIYAQYNKPKVKLGPRPKVSMDAKRPHTSGTSTQSAARPVSTLPANMRIANRKTMEPKRPKSRDSSAVPSIAFPAPPPMPAFPVPPSMSTMADLPIMSQTHPPKSPASVRSMTLPGYPNHGQKSNGKSQEKQRLMKALELRKKQMKAKEEMDAKAAEIAAGLVVDDERSVGRNSITGELLTVGEPDPLGHDESKTHVPHPTESEVTQLEGEADSIEPVLEESTRESVKDEATSSLEEEHDRSTLESKNMQPILDEAVTPAPLETRTPAEVVAIKTLAKHDETTSDESNLPSSVVDSGVDVISTVPETDDLNSAASASSPTTAQTQTSSCAPSTRPSSLSEDDHISAAVSNGNDCHEDTLQRLERAADASQNEDGEESIESTPTVKPDNSSPVSSSRSLSPPQLLPPEHSTGVHIVDEALTRKSNRESVIFVPSSKHDDTTSERKSKRESVVFSPATEPVPTEERLSKREKRESMVLTVPKRRSESEGKERRLAPVDPNIRISVHGDNSEEYLSDDSFMEELQSATVQEAKPISVSKSPITPFFPRKASVSESERSFSQQSRPGRLSPEESGSRKISGAWPPQASVDRTVVPKKINVSSGISQRIKALAEKSNRESSGSVSPLATPDAPASIVAHRKSSFFSTPPEGNSPSGKLVNRLSLASFSKLSHSNSSTPNRESVLQLPPPSRDGPTVYNVKQAAEKPESVQVTARIIRDARPLKPSLQMPSEGTPLDLHRSQITIDHQKSAGKSPVGKSPVKMEPTSPRPPSSSHSKDQGGVPRSSSESSWRSFGRRLSESRSGSAPRSLSAHSSESEDKREDRKEKKDSRTSKFFKRMSSVSSMSRKGHQEEEHASTSLPSVREPPPAVQVGDLNVQFPDTLVSPTVCPN